MELRFKGKFLRDLRSVDRPVLEEVRDAILNVQSAHSLSQIVNLKKLRDYRTLYRIRVADNYRIGVVVRKNVVWFVRFGHRSSFYGKFP